MTLRALLRATAKSQTPWSEPFLKVVSRCSRQNDAVNDSTHIGTSRMPSLPATVASTAAAVPWLRTFSSTPPRVPPRPTASNAQSAATSPATVTNQPTALRNLTNTIATSPDAILDQDVWGSDFEDVAYTEVEQAEFDVRFAHEALEIANAQRDWFAPPSQERFNRD